jgi:hypothetical protein
MGRLGGRPAIMVGADLERWRPMFETVEPLGRLPHETKRTRQSFVGLGYRGPAGP